MISFFSTWLVAGQLFSSDVCDLAERLERVLVAMTADPTRPLSSVDLLDEREHARLDGWGNRAVLTQPASTPVSIPVLFDAQVARTPEAVAIRCEGRSLDLPGARGGGEPVGAPVGRRRVWAPVSVWRCCFPGPLRRSWRFWRCSRPGRLICRSTRRCPMRGCEFVVADAAPIAAVTTAQLRSRLDGCDLLVIDVNDPRIDSYPGTALPAPAADDIAHLIYTSGTTGVPKGVAVTHHNVTQLIESLDAGLPAVKVWPHCHSLAFDASVWEIWAPLLHGGRLVVVPE